MSLGLQQETPKPEKEADSQSLSSKPSFLYKFTRGIAKFILAIIALIILLLLLVAGVLFTNTGLNVALWGAQKALPQLQTGETEGALLTHFIINDLAFKDDSLNIDTSIKRLELGLEIECLMLPAVCVNKLGLSGVKFSMPELPPSTPEEESVVEDEGNTLFSTPIAANIDSVELYDIEVDVLGYAIKFEAFTSSLAMVDETLSVYPTLLHALQLTLAAAEAEQKDVIAVTSGGESAQPTETNQITEITLPEVWIPLSVDVTSFTLTNFTLHGETPIIVNEALLSAYTSGHEVSIREFNIDMPQVEGALNADVELAGDYPLTLETQLLLKETDLAGQSLKLSTSGSVADLSLDAQLRDVINLDIAGDIEPLKSNLPFALDLTNGVVQWPLKGASDFDVQIETLNTQGSLDGYTLELIAAVQGGVIPDVDLDVTGEGNLEQIELERIDVKTLGGQILGSVMANWQQPINWGADVTLTEIQPGLQWDQAEGSISGELSTTGYLTDAGGWVVDLPLLDIDGLLRGYPLKVEGALAAQDLKADGDIELVTPNLSLAHGPNKISLKGKLDKNWAMDTQIQLKDIAKSVPELKGELNGELDLRGPLAEPDIVMDLIATGLAWEELVTVESIAVKGEITPLPSPKGDISVAVRNVVYDEQVVDSADLNFAGSQKEHELTFDIVSDLISGGIGIEGGLEQEPGLAWQGQLTDAEFTTIQGTWRLDHSPELAFYLDQQLAKAEAHCWLQASSSVCLSKNIEAGKSGEAFVDINGFDFEQIQAFIPEGTTVEGLLNLSTRFKWSPTAPIEAQAKLTLPAGQVTQSLERPLVVGWNEVEFTASLMEDNLTSAWKLDLKDNGDLSGYANIDDVLNEEREIDGRIQLSKLNLDFLEPLFGEFSRVTANIETDIRLFGPIMKPKVDGFFRVDGITAMGDITPVEVKSGDIQLDFAGYSALLDASVMTQEGELELTGDADWNDLNKWSTNLAIFAEELRVEVPPIVNVRVQPDMKVAIRPGKIKIDGKVNLPWGRILVEALPESAVSVSSDEVLLDENLQPVESGGGIPFEIDSNIKIHIGNDFRLSAFGLKGGLVGDLNVTQQKKGPFIIGEINIENGSYRSFGQDLIIDEGKILFNGPADQPYLSIKAIRNPDNTEDDVVAGIKVTGPADEPEITIFSDPAMPQANALSYILRGQDIDGEAGGDAMTTALIGISLAKSGQVVGEIGEAFGVQDLQLDTAGSGDESQVTVSGYILPGLQVKYGVGIFDSIGEFTVRYRLFTDFYVEAVSGADNAVDLLYQFQFD